MSYVLFNVITNKKFRSYADIEGARRGMRAANRNAGWTRIARATSGPIELEWCLPEASARGDSRSMQCGYGPFAIMLEHEFDLHRAGVRRKAEKLLASQKEPDAIVTAPELPVSVEEMKEEDLPVPSSTAQEKKPMVRKMARKLKVVEHARADGEHSNVKAANRVERETKRLMPKFREGRRND